MILPFLIALSGSQVIPVLASAPMVQTPSLENPSAAACFPDANVRNSSAPCEIAQYTMARCSMTTNTVLNFTANQKCLCERDSDGRAFFPAYSACLECVAKHSPPSPAADENDTMSYPTVDDIASQSSIFCGASITGGLNAFYALLSTAVPAAQPSIKFVTMANGTETHSVEVTSTATMTEPMFTLTSSVSSTRASETVAAPSQTGAAGTKFEDLSKKFMILCVVSVVFLALI